MARADPGSFPPEPDAADADGERSVSRGIVPDLADAIIGQTAFARDGGGRLYRYTRGVYKPDGAQFVKLMVKTMLDMWKASEKWSPSRAEAVIEYIAVDAPLLWDKPPTDRINVKNGIVRLTDTGPVLEPHTSAFLSPVQIPVTHDRAAECPAWDAFVGQTFPEDAQEVAFEIIAKLVVPNESDQAAIILVGEGANGKSTYIAGASAFIGATNISSVSLQKLEADRFSVARLFGKLANICADLPSTHLESTSMFKSLTGGDAIQAERKYGEPFEFVPFAGLVFSANYLPTSSDASYAFFRRWRVVPFSRTFEGAAAIPRHELDARLADPRELSGVLNKVLAVLPRLRAQGFTESESMRAALTEFHATTDPLAIWLDAHTIDDPDARVRKFDLLTAYNAANRAAGRPTLSASAFARALKRLRPRVGDRQIKVEGRHEWLYVGIALRADDDAERSRRSRESRDNTYLLSERGTSEERVGGDSERTNSDDRGTRGTPGTETGQPQTTQPPPAPAKADDDSWLELAAAEGSAADRKAARDMLAKRKKAHQPHADAA